MVVEGVYREGGGRKCHLGTQLLYSHKMALLYKM